MSGSGAELVNVPCYVCGESRHLPYAQENGFHLVRCADCGLLYVNPRPRDEAIGAAARTGLHHGDITLDAVGEFHEGKQQGYQRVIRDVYDGEPPPRGTWLDIGCGHGEWLAALCDWAGDGLRTLGVEPSERKRRAARERGLTVGFFDLDEHADCYDRVSMLNVYSHLPDPAQALQRWARLVTPGGELLLETGDSAGVGAPYHHRPFYLPDHLSFASEAIVRRVLLRAGFEVIKVVKYPIDPPRLSGPVHILKEVLKLGWPGKTSQLPRLWPGNMTFDMFVRARRSSSPGRSAESA